ncbi:tyrosine-type recombinase/integrase [Methylomonas koyamae]|uniref:tyrosine-type recombinase/integrase n=1 Tax=Methylomonas koyamae TaxID=702114 RepID=UPI0028737B25|nr:integrase arm-type DNA-binding domain-containing protein [Methylomonas koyamae]WNB73965.1 integrase arm-type DNA-binding domain-containing protein [Methylomonas koyamae]
MVAEKTISLGVYPATSLADARRKADEARALVANGVDPSDNRKADKTARKEAVEQDKRLDAGLPLIDSFEYVTRDWLASTAHTVRDITQQKKQRRFELYVLPAIGRMPIGDVRAPDVFAIVRPLILKNQLETAHRVRSDISGAFAYAIAHGFTDYDQAQAVGARSPLGKSLTTPRLPIPKRSANCCAT